MSDCWLRQDAQTRRGDWNCDFDLESGLKIHQDPLSRCVREAGGRGGSGPHDRSLVESVCRCLCADVWLWLWLCVLMLPLQGGEIYIHHRARCDISKVGADSSPVM